MSQQAAPHGTHPADYSQRGWDRPTYVRPSSGLWLLGLAAVAVVVVVGISFAPDIERYMKIRRM
jgi:hypothetical protein